MSDLPALETSGTGEPVVLLHGFGGAAADWSLVQKHLDGPSVAFDLPGHGAAVDLPGDHGTIATRNAVVEAIEQRDLPRVHLVGHSRGGAIAMLVALKVPQRVASLTLVAPGGCGPEIAADDLAAFARASSAEEIKEALSKLYAPEKVPKAAVDRVVAQRQNPQAVSALQALVPGLTHKGRQGTLDLSLLEAAPFPVQVLWGTRDAVLPVNQAAGFRGLAQIELIEGAGHMLPGLHAKTIAGAVNHHCA